MNRRSVVRFQLLVLAILVVALLGRRMWSGIGGGDGIVIEDVEPFELHHVAFRIGEPTQLKIEAAASRENAVPGAAMAANAWIVKQGEVQPVWRVSQGGAETRGTLIRASDTISLGPGTYYAFFSSYGNDIRATGSFGFFHRIFSGRSNWTSDQDKWKLAIQPVEGHPAPARISHEATKADIPGLVWQTAPMASNSSDRKVFEIDRPVDLHIRAIGELSSSGRDYGWIENLSEARRVWELTPDNTTHAGGHSSNRLFDATVRLEPGVYAAGFETDPSHAPDHWRANPPFNPFAWGITVTTTPEMAEAIKPFDPRAARSPLLELTRVGSDQHERIDFSVADTLDVVVEALGEISSSQQYDYGWIEKETGERAWEMRYANSSYAGGDRYNREALESLKLMPGQYAAHFQTDDSHAYGDWRKDKPRNSDRWGMTLFPLQGDAVAASFTILNRQSNVPSAPPPPGPMVPGLPQIPALERLRALPDLDELMQHVAVRIQSVGNSANLWESFSVPEDGHVLVIAQGEILPTEKYDYAWIERADNGETVWTMSWDNTAPAGGDDRNRLYAGDVDLPAGEYVVRYRSDPSHAYGDFGKIAPDKPSFWGVSVIVPGASE